MSSPKENIEALLCAYVDGDLDAADRARIETHLSTHPQDRRLLEELAATRQVLQNLPRVPAPADLGDSVQGHIERSALLGTGAEQETSEPRLRIWPRVMSLAAIVLLAVGLAALVYSVLPPSNVESPNQVAVNQATEKPAPLASSDQLPQSPSTQYRAEKLVVPSVNDATASREVVTPAPVTGVETIKPATPHVEESAAGTGGNSASGMGMPEGIAPQEIAAAKKRLEMTRLAESRNQQLPGGNGGNAVVLLLKSDRPEQAASTVNIFLTRNNIAFQTIGNRALALDEPAKADGQAESGKAMAGAGLGGGSAHGLEAQSSPKGADAPPEALVQSETDRMQGMSQTGPFADERRKMAAGGVLRGAPSAPGATPNFAVREQQLADKGKSDNQNANQPSAGAQNGQSQLMARGQRAQNASQNVDNTGYGSGAVFSNSTVGGSSDSRAANATNSLANNGANGGINLLPGNADMKNPTQMLAATKPAEQDDWTMTLNGQQSATAAPVANGTMKAQAGRAVYAVRMSRQEFDALVVALRDQGQNPRIVSNNPKPVESATADLPAQIMRPESEVHAATTMPELGQRVAIAPAPAAAPVFSGGPAKDAQSGAAEQDDVRKVTDEERKPTDPSALPSSQPAIAGDGDKKVSDAQTLDVFIVVQSVNEAGDVTDSIQDMANTPSTQPVK